MYRETIQKIAPMHDPRHIEAFMRSENGTLDHLSPSRFKSEVVMACLCIDECGESFAERIAQSYGI